ncbi:hypothetical protein NOR53_3547 [gamma proteobacterium NOR5-3]|nr:hypothetical protein NOR53_3547 [gamma proteobacterium NOR5-3]
METELRKFYEQELESSFKFSDRELKRTQFCLDLAAQVIDGNYSDSVADIGPGRRLFTGMLCETPQKKVCAVDIKEYSGVKIESINYQFIKSDISSISQSFDYTFCFEVLEHNDLNRLDELAKKIRSVTRKKAVISMPYYEKPVKTKGHFFTLDTKVILECLAPESSDIYLLYREHGFSYIFFVYGM